MTLTADMQHPPQLGETVIYHVGHLADDRRRDDDLDATALRLLVWAGWRYSKRHAEHTFAWQRRGPVRCHLFQRRLEDGRYEYLAVGRR